MQNSFSESRRGIFLTLLFLGMVTALVLVPSQFRSEAGSAKGEGLITRTISHNNDLAPMWDIREDETARSREFVTMFRGAVGKTASDVADIRDGFVRGEASLASRLPDVKIEYNTDIRTPEIITPDVWNARIEFLTGPSEMKRSEILRSFIKQNNDLVGVTDRQVDSLKTFADYTNP